MAEVTLTLHRIFEKGKLCFELPKEPNAICALKKILTSCHTKNDDWVSVTLARPYAPRSTGEHSQNHHLNGHIMQICQETGNDYDTVKFAIKEIAMEQFGYPFQTIGERAVPKRESKCNTEECSYLIEAAHYLAAELSIVLREV